MLSGYCQAGSYLYHSQLWCHCLRFLAFNHVFVTFHVEFSLIFALSFPLATSSLWDDILKFDSLVRLVENMVAMLEISRQHVLVDDFFDGACREPTRSVIADSHTFVQACVLNERWKKTSKSVIHVQELL